jgi:hypothetical protein
VAYGEGYKGGKERKWRVWVGGWGVKRRVEGRGRKKHRRDERYAKGKARRKGEGQ